MNYKIGELDKDIKSFRHRSQVHAKAMTIVKRSLDVVIRNFMYPPMKHEYDFCGNFGNMDTIYALFIELDYSEKPSRGIKIIRINIQKFCDRRTMTESLLLELLDLLEKGGYISIKRTRSIFGKTRCKISMHEELVGHVLATGYQRA